MHPEPMPITIRDFKDPAEINRVVFRYYRQVHFMDLLSKSAVWFTNLDQFKEDPLEATLPRPTHEQRLLDDQKLKEQFSHMVPPETFDSMTARDIAGGRKHTAVNCWHMGEDESPAMWDKYGRHGVMVQSTVFHISRAFNRASPTDDLPQVGPVRYIDFRNDTSFPIHESYDTFRRAFIKDISFSHEKELRIAHLNFSFPTKGLHYRCHLPNLIQAVVMAPTASDNFIRLVASTLKRKRLDVPLLRSKFS